MQWRDDFAFYKITSSNSFSAQNVFCVLRSVSIYIEPSSSSEKCFENSTSGHDQISHIRNSISSPLSARVIEVKFYWIQKALHDRPENDDVPVQANGESHQLHHALQTINFKVWSLTEDLLDNKSKYIYKCFNALLWSVWPALAECFRARLRFCSHDLLFLLLTKVDEKTTVAFALIRWQAEDARYVVVEEWVLLLEEKRWENVIKISRHNFKKPREHEKYINIMNVDKLICRGSD